MPAFRLARRPPPSRFTSLFILTLSAALAGCGGGEGDAAVTPPDADPGAAGTYELRTVNGLNVPAVIVDEVLNGTTLRGEITSGRIVVKADGTWTYAIRGRWWTNGRLTSDKTSTTSGTWSQPDDGKLVLAGATGGSFDVQRTWFSLTEMKRVVDNGLDATWPYVFVRP